MQITDRAYTEHPVFKELDRYANFYQQLAMSVFQFISMGTKAICNIDTYVYSSMQGTVESIKAVLLAGRINDAYALLRKYYDSAVINVYSNLYLKDNFSIENFVVEKINNWLQGKETLPEYRVMSQYIRASKTLKPLNDLLYGDDRYKLLRDRCNDHTHYNFYHHVMLNDNEIYIKNRAQWLEKLKRDVQDIFVLHLGHVFFLNDHYMMSSDHLDALECNMKPEEDSQYWVAPFIQEMFHEVITPWRPDITAAIKAKSAMQLS
ncbi:MAG: hypothetical protein ABIN18_29755 [Pseudomonadota bacterium]